MDFGVEISGDNPERQGPADLHDQGVADEPANLEGNLTAIKNVKGGASAVEAANGELNFQNCEKAWIYDANGAFVKYLVSPSSFPDIFTRCRCLPRKDAAGSRVPLTEGGS